MHFLLNKGSVFIYMCIALCLHIHLYLCVPDAQRSQKVVLESLEPELEMVVGHSVGPGN